MPNPIQEVLKGGYSSSEVQIGGGVMGLELFNQFTGSGAEIPTELWYLLIVQFAGRSLVKFAVEWRRIHPTAQEQNEPALGGT